MTLPDVLAAMERVVAEATQAKWRAGRMDMVSYEAHGGPPFKNLYVDDPDGEMHLGHRLPRTIARAEGDNCLADAAMIATFDPPTLTKLLAVVKAAHGRTLRVRSMQERADTHMTAGTMTPELWQQHANDEHALARYDAAMADALTALGATGTPTEDCP